MSQQIDHKAVEVIQANLQYFKRICYYARDLRKRMKVARRRAALVKPGLCILVVAIGVATVLPFELGYATLLGCMLLAGMLCPISLGATKEPSSIEWSVLEDQLALYRPLDVQALRVLAERIRHKRGLRALDFDAWLSAEASAYDAAGALSLDGCRDLVWHTATYEPMCTGSDWPRRGLFVRNIEPDAEIQSAVSRLSKPTSVCVVPALRPAPGLS